MKVNFAFNNNCGQKAYVHMAGPLSRESRIGYDPIDEHATNQRISYQGDEGIFDSPDGNWTCSLATSEVVFDGPYVEATIHVDKCPNEATITWNLIQGGDGKPIFGTPNGNVTYS
jgi:hypothetical protein